MLIIVIKKIIKMNRVNSISQYQSKSINDSQRINPFSQSSATPMSKSSQISNIIECLICCESVRQSHMCPSCCRLFCESCIKNWIKNKKGQCPSCLKPLNHSNLLNCSILGRQIQQALSKSVSKIRNPQMSSSTMMSPSGAKVMFPKCQTPYYQSPSSTRVIEVLCDKHQLKLDYFCQQCNVSLCSDCAVLSTQHQGHRICKISQKKSKFKQGVLELEKKVSNAKQNIEKERNELMTKKDKIISDQRQKQNSLTVYLDKAFQQNLQKYSKTIQSREGLFEKACSNYENASNFFLSSYNQAEKYTKPQLVRKSAKLRQQIQKFMNDNTTQPILPAERVECLIVPDFEQKTFILDNYNYLRQKGDVLISQPLYSKGTEWRLKIYPGGVNHVANKGLNQYLAIHLQMSKGHCYPCWYRYRIQLVNQANRSKCMSFEFENDFKQGSEWRLDNFIQISTLYSDNFINKQEGFIEIVLYVRCLSYYHAVEQQNKIISEKQGEVNRNYSQLLNLRKKAALAGIKISSKSNSPELNKSNSQRSQQSSKTDSKRVIAIDEND